MTTSVELATELFATPDRLGWEYSEPLAPTPFLDEEPVWTEPPPLDIEKLEKQKATALRKAPARAVKGAIAIVVVSLLSPLYAVVALCAAAAWVGVPIYQASNEIAQAKQRHRTRRDAAQVEHRSAHNKWKKQASSHDRDESERVGTTMLWYPLHLLHQPGRVDVFGGTGHGWASFVVTFGSSLLAGGNDVIVVDLSDQRVGRELAEFTEFAGGEGGTRVTSVDLPDESARLDLLAGLDADGVADLLAEAVQLVRRAGTNDDTGLRTLDVELVHTVVSQLETQPPLTFGRIVAGLRVLRRMYDVDVDGGGPLSTGEVRALTTQVDRIGRTDRVHDELQFLTSTLDLLAKEAPGATADDVGTDADADAKGIAGMLDRKGLCVLATAGSQRRRKEILDGVVFHRILAELRDRSSAMGGRVLIVAGADRLGLDGLEELTAQSRRLGLRLVLLFEHLRGDLRDLVGGSGSTTVFMRLGNFQEAETAAQQIGRGQKLVLSQLTRQIGETLTTGTSHATGTQEGTSTTRTEGGGRSTEGVMGSRQSNWSRSEGTHRSESWQATRSTSDAQSKTDSVTLGRVHEFIVEPTQIQDLPHTAFVLVASGGSSRRITLGDCNPGISLLPRVADQPLELPAG